MTNEQHEIEHEFYNNLFNAIERQKAKKRLKQIDLKNEMAFLTETEEVKEDNELIDFSNR